MLNITSALGIFLLQAFRHAGALTTTLRLGGVGGNHLSLRNATGQSFFPSTVFYWVASIATHMPGATFTSSTFPCLMTNPHKFATTVASINGRTKEQTHVHLHAPLSRASCIIHDVCKIFAKNEQRILEEWPSQSRRPACPCWGRCLGLPGAVWGWLMPSGSVWDCLGLSGAFWACLGLSGVLEGIVGMCLGLSALSWGCLAGVAWACQSLSGVAGLLELAGGVWKL